MKNGYAPDEFLSRCRDEGLRITASDAHLDLYHELVRLDKDNKNGVWARIIKNNFAPLFVGRVDYVAGNPPWINWRNLPDEYREAVAPLWQDYGLFTQKGLSARLGGGMDDISVLMLFVAADHFLAPAGHLGFVITQTIFKSAGGGKGFRRLKLGEKRFLKILRVCDFLSVQPFEGAMNRTAVVTLGVSDSPNRFPVRYRMFSPAQRGRPASELLTNEVSAAFIATDLDAFPIEEEVGSSWITVKPQMHKIIEKIRGKSKYRARIGAHSGGAAGVFWVDVLKETAQGKLIRNLHDAGRNKFPEVTKAVEPHFVRPILRGRDVTRWAAFSRHSIVIPYETNNQGKAVAEKVLKNDYPKTYDYFQTFKDRLIDRPHYRQHFEPSGQPWYSMYNVGNYTFARHQVVWREQSTIFKCCVVPNSAGKLFVADAKLIVVECASSDDAHFLAACLNSAPARFFIQSYAIQVQVSTHVLAHVRVPEFDGSALHQELAEGSRLCHGAAIRGDAESIARAEAGIDKAAAKLWGITDRELKSILEALNDIEAPKRTGDDAEEVE